MVATCNRPGGITSGNPDLALLVGVDTQVFHGYVNCGAVGAITGIGNVLPDEILHYAQLCRAATEGDPQARSLARELEQALLVLSTFDEGPDLVLHYKYMLTLRGDSAYERHFNETDQLSPAQRGFAEDSLNQFTAWWNAWPGKEYLKSLT